jgi:D-mannonate dehydratase
LVKIYSDEGDQDEAINSLIDAKMEFENSYALCDGNIFAKFKNDIVTAMKNIMTKL